MPSTPPATLQVKEDKLVSWIYDTLYVIVLYNIDLSDSLTFISLTKALNSIYLTEPVLLLVCDNSLTPLTTLDTINPEGLFTIRYLHDPENPGVSLSYNRAAELAGILNKRMLFVLDQDTIFPPDAISSYQQSLSSFPGHAIYAPQLYNGSSLFSPCKYSFQKGSNLKSIVPGVHLMKGMNVLNSGLLIDMNAFQRVEGYDETVKLYFSDFIFFDRLKKFYTSFVVINCHLQHQLSSVDYSDSAFAMKRFTYYCQGAHQASTNNKVAWCGYFITVGLRSILMSQRFGSIQFSKVFLQVFLGGKDKKLTE